MKLSEIRIICFSPTRTSLKIATSVAEGVGSAPIAKTDITKEACEWSAPGDALAVIAVPVYGGKVASLALKRMERIKGENTPAVLIVVYMTWRGKKAKLAGLHFTYPEDVQQFSDDAEKPNSVLCFIPLLFIVFTFNVMGWAIEICLALGIIIAICLFWKHIPKSELLGLFNSSAASSVTIILNTAAIVGYGAVAKLTPCYSAAVDLITTSEANPYVLAAVGANIFVCILGSSSGGITLMYTSLGDTFLHYGTLGYNLGFIHRLCAMGSGGLDTMPWNGGVISVFGVCKTTLKDSYKDTFVTSGLIPLVCTLAICLPLCIILT